MARTHTNREPMLATLRQCDLASVSIVGLAIIALSLHRNSVAFHDFSPHIDATNVELNSNVARSQTAKVHRSLHFHGRSYWDRYAWIALNFTDRHVIPLSANALHRRRKFPGTSGVVRIERAELCMCLGVIAFHIITDHAMGVDEMAERIHACLHALNPFAGNAVGAAIVERRYDVALQQIIQSFGLDLVLKVQILI